jgi:hypothetical protein
MSFRQPGHHRLAAVAATVALTGAVGAPAAAAANSKPLTKAEVIALIKHYSKPGRAGPDGPTGPMGAMGAMGAGGSTGPAGSYTIGADSGLSLSGNLLSVVPGSGLSVGASGVHVDSGQALGFDSAGHLKVNVGAGLAVNSSNVLTINPNFGAFGACPVDESVYAISASGSGSESCGYANVSSVLSSIQSASSPNGLWLITNNGTVNNAATVAATTAPGAPGAFVTYLVQANVQLASADMQTVFCQLLHNGSAVETGATTFGPDPNSTASPKVGYSQVNLQMPVNATTGDTFTVQCDEDTTATGAEAESTTGGSIAVWPLS